MIVFKCSSVYICAKNGVLRYEKINCAFFLVVACAVSLANTEVSASDDTVINQYLLLKNEYNITKSRYMLSETRQQCGEVK